MLRELKATFALKKLELICSLSIIAGVVVLAFIIDFFTEAEGNQTTLTGNWIAGFIAGAYVGINIFFKAFISADEVPRGIAFGMTRKKLFTYMRLFDFVEVVLIALIIIAIPTSVQTSIVIKVAVLLFGFATLVSGLVGSNIIRYGKIVYWIYYIAVIAVSLGVPRLTHIFPAIKDFLAGLVDHFVNPVYSQVGFWFWMLVFVMIAVCINWLANRRLAVNNNY